MGDKETVQVGEHLFVLSSEKQEETFFKEESPTLTSSLSSSKLLDVKPIKGEFRGDSDENDGSDSDDFDDRPKRKRLQKKNRKASLSKSLDEDFSEDEEEKKRGSKKRKLIRRSGSGSVRGGGEKGSDGSDNERWAKGGETKAKNKVTTPIKNEGDLHDLAKLNFPLKGKRNSNERDRDWERERSNAGDYDRTRNGSRERSQDRSYGRSSDGYRRSEYDRGDDWRDRRDRDNREKNWDRGNDRRDNDLGWRDSGRGSGGSGGGGGGGWGGGRDGARPNDYSNANNNSMRGGNDPWSGGRRAEPSSTWGQQSMMTGGGTWGLQPQNGILGAGGNGVDQYPMYGQSTSALPFNPPNAPSNFTQHTPPEAVQYSAPVQAPVAPPAPTPNPVPFPAPDPTARVVVAVTPSPKKDKEKLPPASEKDFHAHVAKIVRKRLSMHLEKGKLEQEQFKPVCKKITLMVVTKEKGRPNAYQILPEKTDRAVKKLVDGYVESRLGNEEG